MTKHILAVIGILGGCVLLFTIGYTVGFQKGNNQVLIICSVDPFLTPERLRVEYDACAAEVPQSERAHMRMMSRTYDVPRH